MGVCTRDGDIGTEKNRNIVFIFESEKNKKTKEKQKTKTKTKKKCSNGSSLTRKENLGFVQFQF